ncbi:MAG: type I methionyl aminopeptidase [Lachnospiraceae bacterium]|nr:type I methionyl aminopeptidase [Lachnospiraceae bacterium]
MAVTIKSQREIDLMRQAGKILAYVHEELAKYIKPGISTHELDMIARDLIKSKDCIPSFLGYEGYPASVCLSLNDEVVHGIPRKDVLLLEGDIISVDCGVIYKGYQSDAARTYGVGKITPEAQKLIDVTKESFFVGIKEAVKGNHINDISGAIEDYCHSFGYSLVEDLTGHGIGTEMHEDPQIPNFRQRRQGIKILPGMTFAIEPMVNIGGPEVAWCDDEWTVVTEDGSLSAHYENTILITDGEPEILSLL